MKRARRVDANQALIVAQLRQAGCSVEILAEVGDGCPDLLVGYRGRNYLLEVKQPNEKLNALQRTWHQTWLGVVVTVTTAREAFTAVGL